MRGLPERSRRLRKDQTDAERKLWSRLQGRGVNGTKFRRQHPIGRYIVDFCCPEHKLIVEVDGSQHIAMADRAQRRTAFLLQQGYWVLRFWDNDVLTDTDAVVQHIADALIDPPLNLPFSPEGRRKGCGAMVRRGKKSKNGATA